MGDWAKLAAVAVGAWLIALSYFDIRQRRLPNVLTLPGAVMVLAVATGSGRGVTAAAGAVAMFTMYAVVHVVAPKAMGAGDVKLAIGLGALTGAFGPDVWLLAALGASILTAVLGLVRLIGGDRSALPHGPSMCVAAACAVAVVVI
ncbi:prepilin peptidase [Mycolicibacterium cyprinidarum]|uniref:Prepilin peptidase n=1 Tax=Mycolicibacterium cyprinidarum TaxID=2860311 RepID=A0ABQ4V4G9_9MYCO|nr:prepilin peptidase [Mycolicibacterium sp. NGTWS0302]GJF08937.1 prepilin peptidase [Mycolicibacterium sp. NGTWSNA01]GJF09860.1 prepilin peptidase [Mycolicibacterium sp. NGTWS1803]